MNIASDSSKPTQEEIQKNCADLMVKYADDACYICKYRQPCMDAEKQREKE